MPTAGMPQLTFYGGVRTVTGSMHLPRAGGASLLLDCGLFQGRRDEAEARNRTFPFDPAAIDQVLLSHAHIDHSGNLPTLVAQGFAGRIHATAATCDLCALMLPDSAHIQEEDAHFVNTINHRAGRPRREPLYTCADADACLRRLQGHTYLEPFTPAPGVVCRFVDAGHVLGAALTMLEARLVLGQLLQRWPGLSLVDKTPDWGNKPAYRGLNTLRLRCQ